jgi:mono/diheme cytochrome c family protein
MGPAAAVRYAGAWLLLAACAPAPRPGSTQPHEPAARVLGLPGPAPRGRTTQEAARLNHGCEGCHAEIALEWRASWHARSQTDAAYQRAFALEPLRFCQGCHAPEADPAAPVPQSAAELGVACVTCHVVNGDVLAASQAPSDSAPSFAAQAPPHPVLRDARLDGSAACAGCHEFEFPDRSARSRPELMQATVSEHARSEQSEQACAACHMPLITAGSTPHRSHAFAGGHDPELVRRAVDVTAVRVSNSARLTITPRGLGHAFPTGDLFRRVELSAEAIGPEWQVVAKQQRYLARHWQKQPSPFGVVLRSATLDDRPLATAVVVDLPLGDAARALPITWRASYQRVEHPRSEREQDSSVEGEIELAAGTLEKPR